MSDPDVTLVVNMSAEVPCCYRPMTHRCPNAATVLAVIQHQDSDTVCTSLPICDEHRDYDAVADLRTRQRTGRSPYCATHGAPLLTKYLPL